MCWTEGFLEWNWGSVLDWGVLGVELRGFRCGTEGSLVLNWGGLVLNWGAFGVELRDYGGWKGVVLVWNWCVEWWVCLELRGTHRKWGLKFWIIINRNWKVSFGVKIFEFQICSTIQNIFRCKNTLTVQNFLELNIFMKLSFFLGLKFFQSKIFFQEFKGQNFFI